MIRSGCNAGDLASAGWGLVMSVDLDPAIREALGVLVDHRRAYAERDDMRLFRELTYLPGESKLDFQVRNGAAPGPVEPRNIPYYILIVGGPEAIPFDFQYSLDLQYAVGRLDFESPTDYAAYAQAVVEFESSGSLMPRRAVFFGVQNEDDVPTQLSVEHLVEPLARRLGRSCPDWDIEVIIRELATKNRLAALLGGEETPALLFTASHAVRFKSGSPRQSADQGAILCADWPGPRSWHGRGSLPVDFYLAGADIREDVRLDGLINFHFGCFSAGTPRFSPFGDNCFGQGDVSNDTPYAPRAFISRLPQRLLSKGALAVIGNVGQPFATSFMWGKTGGQVQAFEGTFNDLFDGLPVGLAMEYFDQRHAELASDLVLAQSAQGDRGKIEIGLTQEAIWTAYNDARSYVILGDPAVRLRA